MEAEPVAFRAATPILKPFNLESGAGFDVTPTANRFLVERRLEIGSSFVTVTNWFDDLMALKG